MRSLPKVRTAGWMALSLTACVVMSPSPPKPTPPPTGLDRYRSMAEQGDPEGMVIAGYLLGTGEGTEPNLVEARRWFEQAAELGHPVARLNLAVLHFLGGGGTASVAAARREFRRSRPALRALGLSGIGGVEGLVDHVCSESLTPDRGRDVYRTFCSGCHGRSGVAAYGEAPSFALGERLEKPTETLLGTVAGGHSDMPRWDDKLPEEWLVEAVDYARTLPSAFSYGLLQVHDDGYASFRFGPMADGVEAPRTTVDNGDRAMALRDLCPTAD